VSGLEEVILSCAAFLSALGIALLISYQARHLRLVDIPNERSSHSRPTPRGGGLGIFIAVTAAVWYMAPAFHTGIISKNTLLSASAVAVIGLWDDVRSVAVTTRLLVHVFAAVLLISGVPGDAIIQMANGVSIGGMPVHLLSCILVVSAINIFNFMDGIDGLAASEAVFITGGAALTLFLGGYSHTPVAVICVLVCAASAGFLLVNWAPARIFLGDVGSGFLGFAISALALWSSFEKYISIWVWLILGGVFIVDASITFFRRLFRGENVTSAHRMHGYQRLARAWSSHRKATVLAMSVNMFWLLPLAILAASSPSYAPALAAVALIPIGIAAWVFGAGLPE
jgi:Fuc2NAc and GlcNAc transferase